MIVELRYRLVKNAGELAVRYELKNGVAVSNDATSQTAIEFEKYGFQVNDKLYFPKDGKAFLDALVEYYYATIVEVIVVESDEMKNISELTGNLEQLKEHVHSNGPSVRNPDREEFISVQNQSVSGKQPSAPAAYESAVFNYLAEHKEALGIDNIYQRENSSVDGEIELKTVNTDGKPITVVLEIKFRMNWMKACQAKWQIEQFLKICEKRPQSAVVIFEKFTGDWERGAKSRACENGWYEWYRGFSELNGLEGGICLLRFCEGKLEGFQEEIDRPKS